MDDLGVKSPIIKIDGKVLAREWVDDLVEARFELELALPARAELRFRDFGFKYANSSTAALGAAIEFSLPDASGTQPLLKGEITSVEVDVVEDAEPELVVVAMDKSHRLAREVRSETYLKMSPADIIGKIAGRHGLSARVTKVTTPKLEHLLQVGTDYELLSSLAVRYGLDWWVEAAELKVAPIQAGSTVITLTYGEDLLAFNVRATGGRGGTATVSGWDTAKQKSVTKTAKAQSVKGVEPDSAFARRFLNKADKVLGPRATQTTIHASGVPDEVQTVAEAIAKRELAAEVVATGVVDGDARLRPGRAVKIERLGPVDGTYHLTRVEHRFGRGEGLRTFFEAGDRRPAHLVDLLGNSGNGHAEVATAPPLPAGLVVGIVTNLNDPGKEGRVKVKLPTLAAEHETNWARVASVGGGKDRGLVFQPELNDEVLVGFEQGDLRFPVVLGGVFSKNATIPKVNLANDEVASRVIRSRKGHAIWFMDDASEQKQAIDIELGGQKQKIHLGKDRIDVTSSDAIPFTIKVGTSEIAIAKNGDISLKGANITIEAKQNLTLKGPGGVMVDGAANVTAKSGGSSVKVEPATVNVQGSGMVAVKGAQVKIN